MQNEKLSKAFTNIGHSKKAGRAFECGEMLQFSECATDGTHPKFLKRANFCKIRLCPMCSWRKSLVVARQVRLVAHEAGQRKKLRWIMLTLTIRNMEGPMLSDELTHMFQAWNALARRKVFKDSIEGWFRALEVTYNAKKKTYHPHFHVLLAVRPEYFSGQKYMKQRDWVTLWQDVLNVDYTPVVDVRVAKNKKQEDVQNIDGAIYEVAKYTLKPSEIFSGDEDQTTEVVGVLDNALRNRRLIAYGGLLKEIWSELEKRGKVSDVEDADLVQIDDEEIAECKCSVCQSDMIEHIYSWNRSVKQYVG